jgi:hypothetical protein
VPMHRAASEACPRGAGADTGVRVVGQGQRAASRIFARSGRCRCAVDVPGACTKAILHPHPRVEMEHVDSFAPFGR